MIAVETELVERRSTIPEGRPQVEVVEAFPLRDTGQPVVLLAVLAVVRLRKIRKDGEEDRECLLAADLGELLQRPLDRIFALRLRRGFLFTVLCLEDAVT